MRIIPQSVILGIAWLLLVGCGPKGSATAARPEARRVTTAEVMRGIAPLPPCPRLVQGKQFLWITRLQSRIFAAMRSVQRAMEHAERVSKDVVLYRCLKSKHLALDKLHQQITDQSALLPPSGLFNRLLAKGFADTYGRAIEFVQRARQCI